jgi:hypothetical protein
MEGALVDSNAIIVTSSVVRRVCGYTRHQPHFFSFAILYITILMSNTVRVHVLSLSCQYRILI